MLLVIGGELPPLFILNQGDPVAALETQLEVVLLLSHFCLYSPPVEERARNVNVFLAQHAEMQIARTRVAVSASQGVRVGHFVFGFGLELQLVVGDGPETIKQHALYVNTLVWSGRHTQKAFQPAIVAFVSPLLEVRRSLLVEARLTEFFSLVHKNKLLSRREPSIAEFVETHIALLAVVEWIVLLVVRIAAPQASSVQSIFSFLALLVLFLAHELLKLFLLRDGGLRRPVVVLHELIVLEKIQKVYIFIF